MKDRFENLNKKKNKEMKKFYQQEGVEVPKGKPGRKKKATHPSAVIPAIPEGGDRRHLHWSEETNQGWVVKEVK